jgi:hypothetical protein
MELNEFLKKFLPEYEQKYETKGKYCYELENEWNSEVFPEALQNYDKQQLPVGLKQFIDFCQKNCTNELQHFADRICEKQRENCVKAYRDTYTNFDNFDMRIFNNIKYHTKQPKIDEL